MENLIKKKNKVFHNKQYDDETTAIINKIKEIDNDKDDSALTLNKTRHLIKLLSKTSRRAKWSSAINIQKVFLRFTHINDTQESRQVLIHLYLESIRLFPDSEKYISHKNLMRYVFSLTDRSLQKQFFITYTKNLEKLTINHLLLVFDFIYKDYLISMNDTKETLENDLLGDFFNYLCKYVIKIQSKKRLEQERNWISIVLETFLDSYIILVIKNIKKFDDDGKEPLRDKNFFNQINVVFFKNLFNEYFCFLKVSIHKNNLLLQKMIMLICLYCSFGNQQYQGIGQQLFSLLIDFLPKKNLNISQYIFEIFIILDKIIKNENLPSKYFEPTIHKRYVTFIINGTSDDYTFLYKNTNIEHYREYTERLFKFNHEYNIYKGCLLLISKIYDYQK